MKKLVVAAAIVAGLAFGAPAIAQTKPTVPVIVKDMTSPYWQAVLAGARKAGQDLGVNVVELGAQSEKRRKRPNQHTRGGRRIKSRGDRHRAHTICRARKAD